MFSLIILAEKLSFGNLSFNTILTYLFLISFMTSLFILIYQDLLNVKKFKIATLINCCLALIIYLIPLSFIIYTLNFDTAITKDVLYAIFQSHSNEAYQFIYDYISLKYVFLFIYVPILICFLFYQQEIQEIPQLKKSLLVFFVIVFYIITFLQFSNLRIPNFFIESVNQYHYELNLFKEVQAKRNIGEIQFHAFKKKQGETYIIAIGESLHKKHMGIYGYFRNTTPLLSKIKSELFIFDNIYSNHTHTVPVMKLGLTEANQYNKKLYYDSLSIIDILKKSHVETYWLTNQTIYGAWDNMISVIAANADNLVTLNSSIGKQTKTQKYDGALIDEVKIALSDKTDKTKVIFVHLIGNHNNYKSRYPQTFTKLNKEITQGYFGKNPSININNYDNSVLYNDFVISSILKELQKEQNVSGFIYLSDHADDVLANLGHNSGKFTYHMTQIPMIAWFNNQYKQTYPKNYNTLLKHTHTLFSNDMLYDTIIGLLNIKTKRYNEKYDFTSNRYRLEPQNALVLHGKKTIQIKIIIFIGKK